MAAILSSVCVCVCGVHVKVNGGPRNTYSELIDCG